MKVNAVLPYVFGLALVLGVYGAIAQMPTTASPKPEKPIATHASVPLTWVPDWLMVPLSRAIADATDTRDRKG